MTSAAIVLLILGLAAWLWLDTLRVRELAVRVAGNACRAAGVQLLDETVALCRLDLRRCPTRGGVRLRRVYQFEFSTDGRDRRSGSLTLLGRQVQGICLPGTDMLT